MPSTTANSSKIGDAYIHALASRFKSNYITKLDTPAKALEKKIS